MGANSSSFNDFLDVKGFAWEDISHGAGANQAYTGAPVQTGPLGNITQAFKLTTRQIVLIGAICLVGVLIYKRA